MDRIEEDDMWKSDENDNFLFDSVFMENDSMDVNCEDEDMCELLTQRSSKPHQRVPKEPAVASDRPKLPENILKSIENARDKSMPEKSRERYMRTYRRYRDWIEENEFEDNSPKYIFSEEIMLAYFNERSQSSAPNSLWSTFSAIKSVVRRLHNLDLSKHTELHFLKVLKKGYEPKKAAVLWEPQTAKFIREASDEVYLVEKVALIFGLCGGCRTIEMWKLKFDHVHDCVDQETKESFFKVQLFDTKTKKPRWFSILGEYYYIVEKYMKLRPGHATEKKFFLNYQKGNCTNQPIGRNKIASFAKAIAEYLKLPNPEQYTGHCFRRAGTSQFANTGATVTEIMQFGGWDSFTSAKGYVDDSAVHKNERCRKILQSFEKSSVGKPPPRSSNATKTSKDFTCATNLIEKCKEKPPRTIIPLSPHINIQHPDNADEEASTSHPFNMNVNQEENPRESSPHPNSSNINLENQENLNISSFLQKVPRVKTINFNFTNCHNIYFK
ncbi:uncharacterized protein LOC107048788 [Diachasma alloeum]|uniref:uncharacterized protein LOC107048788 n=1 Tax=Diachasma alloeum TaxID=454923 RepID=UPI000738431B|nr:uncharacterized protein LOC107048788 [Diachasma alloeum]